MTTKTMATTNHDALARPSTLPAPSAGELLERNINALNQAHTALTSILFHPRPPIPGLETAIEQAEMCLHDNVAAAIANAVAKASSRATGLEIANQVAVLVAAFPQAGKADPAYGRILCEDVGAQEPTIGALDIACRRLRRSGRFLPVVSEVLDTLARAELELKQATKHLSELPKCLGDARQSLAREIQHEELKEELWRRYERGEIGRDELFFERN